MSREEFEAGLESDLADELAEFESAVQKFGLRDFLEERDINELFEVWSLRNECEFKFGAHRFVTKVDIEGINIKELQEQATTLAEKAYVDRLMTLNNSAWWQRIPESLQVKVREELLTPRFQE